MTPPYDMDIYQRDKLKFEVANAEKHPDGITIRE